MEPRWAYHLPGVAPGAAALNLPQRLRLAWPQIADDPNQSWMTSAHPAGGTLATFPRYDGAAPSLESFGATRPTADGMAYYPSLAPSSADWLIRPEATRPPGEWLTTYRGQSIHVAIAFATPRQLVLCSGGGYRMGQPLSEFGKLGHEIFDTFFSKEGMPFTDARLWRFLFLALRESYWITEEIMEDLDWLTDADINPICQTALGASPKRLAAALAGSALSAPTTPTCP